jgi:D-3-phosphoglycerate dehydrogenase
MKVVFIDATPAMAELARRLLGPADPALTINEATLVPPDRLAAVIGDGAIILDDHTALPTDALAACTGLRHVVFLGTGARSYMDPEALAARGITVHTIKGYGDTAVAEHAIALMWAAARGLARMDRRMRSGEWAGQAGVQLTGRTLGLLGFGGIAQEVARIALGGGMRVIAWNRTPRPAQGVTFVELDQLLAEADVLSLHLLLTDQTRGLLDAALLARLKPGAIVVNTARGALLDEAALIAALTEGRIGHAALDVFDTEPLPPDHPLTRLENVTLSAHSGFDTPEATATLLRRGLDIARDLVGATAAGG